MAPLVRYDWFVKIDPDGVFVPANFRRFLRTRFTDPDMPAYLGHALYFHPRTFLGALCTLRGLMPLS